MTRPDVEFHFDFGSPNAYLAHRVIPGIEARTGVAFRYVPVLLGGIFKATGNVSPMEAFGGIRNKLEYEAIERRRFIERHGLDEFVMNPHFPVNTLQIMRGAVAAGRLGCLDAYADAVFRSMWEESRKMDDPEVVQAVLADNGLPVEDLLAGMQDPEVKAELIANTERSVERGTFGSPSFFVGDELWFGKDRLEDVEREILIRSGSQSEKES